MKDFLYIITLLITITSCSEGRKALVATHSQKLDIKEPSGIVFNPKINQFVIVSDQGKFSLFDTAFNKTEAYKIKKGDLEGVTIANDTLYLLNEAKDQVLSVTLNGKKRKISQKFKLPKTMSKNQGYEGITYDYDQEFFVLVSQNYPNNILVTSARFIPVHTHTLEQSQYLSDIFYHRGYYYILSDADKAVYKVNQDFELSEVYSIPVKDAEGICIVENTLYIVSDEKEKLYTFELEE